MGGHTATAEMLVKAGANLDLQNQHGCTALILATSNGHSATAEVLAKAGANPDLQDNVSDSRGHHTSPFFCFAFLKRNLFTLPRTLARAVGVL